MLLERRVVQLSLAFDAECAHLESRGLAFGQSLGLDRYELVSRFCLRWKEASQRLTSDQPGALV
jgi:hypothetical protein